MNGTQLALLAAAPMTVLFAGVLLRPLFWEPARGRHRR